MKTVAICFMLILCQALAFGQRQSLLQTQVTVSFSNTSIEEILKSLETESLSFVYSPEVFDVKKRVSINRHRLRAVQVLCESQITPAHPDLCKAVSCYNIFMPFIVPFSCKACIAMGCPVPLSSDDLGHIVSCVGMQTCRRQERVPCIIQGSAGLVVGSCEETLHKFFDQH